MSNIIFLLIFPKKEKVLISLHIGKYYATIIIDCKTRVYKKRK